MSTTIPAIDWKHAENEESFVYALDSAVEVNAFWFHVMGGYDRGRRVTTEQRQAVALRLVAGWRAIEGMETDAAVELVDVVKRPLVQVLNEIDVLQAEVARLEAALQETRAALGGMLDAAGHHDDGTWVIEAESEEHINRANQALLRTTKPHTECTWVPDPSDPSGQGVVCSHCNAKIPF